MIIMFEFDEDEINTVLEGLHELPMKRVVNLVTKIHGQYSAQVSLLMPTPPAPEAHAHDHGDHVHDPVE